MSSKDLVEQRVVAHINSTVGKDIKNLHRASLLVDEYKQQIIAIREKLELHDGENPSTFRSVLESTQQAQDSLDFQKEKLLKFRGKLTVKMSTASDMMHSVQTDLDRMHKEQQLVMYLKVLHDIQEISNGLQHAVNGKDEVKIITLYLTLFEHNDSENSIIGRLQAMDIPFLRSYAVRTATYWHKVLTDKFTTEFVATLKAMRWGHKLDEGLKFTPSAVDTQRARMLAENLFLLRSPTEDTDTFESITPTVLCPAISSVTRLLLAPYRERFMFHFTGNRQTNRLDKPEWFYTQLLNWGKETHLVVGKTFQSAAVQSGKVNFNIRLEFVRGLVQLAIEKLALDIEEISRDDSLFAHLLDETLAFESELRDIFGYPSSFPSAICVITQPVYLLKWIALEESFCAHKMDCILQDDAPWDVIDLPLTGEVLRIPKCADQFIRLLDAIKDRYYSLIQPGHQLQFLSLQLELIDSFRRRLVQLHSSGSVESIDILNTINYIRMVLQEWGENVHYLHLHAALVGPNAETFHSVFDTVIGEMTHWSKQLIQGIARKAVNEMKAKSMPYRHDCWRDMPEQNTKEPFILSPSAAEMFHVLITVLHTLENRLSSNIFTATFRPMARQIDQFFLDSMVMNTKFNHAGAVQFQYDMTRNLFTLFGQYQRRVDQLFKNIHDSCKLLTAARGTAILLHETLVSPSVGRDSKQAALKEVGVLFMGPDLCAEVLERRVDIRKLQ